MTIQGAHRAPVNHPFRWNHPRLALVSIIFGFGLLSGVACNLFASFEDQASAIEETLLDDYGIVLESVEKDGDVILIAYDIPWAKAESDILAEVLWIMGTAVEEVSRAERVLVDLSYLGETHMQIAAEEKDIRAALSGAMDIDAFFNTVQIKELRPPESVIEQGLKMRGIDVTEIQVVDGVVSIEYLQGHFESQNELLLTWIEMADYALFADPDAERVILHALLIGQPDVEVEVPSESILAYREGSISPAELLSTISVSRLAEP